MKKIISIVATLLVANLTYSQTNITVKAKALLAKMTLEEKIGQLNLIIPGGAAVTMGTVGISGRREVRGGGAGTGAGAGAGVGGL